MRTITKFAAAAVFVAGMTGTASAQQMSSGGFFKAPVLLAQPGIITVNAVSVPEGGPDESSSAFNVRFTVVVPTASPWFNFVTGMQFFPNGLGIQEANDPILYFGGILPVALLGNMSQGWLSLSIDPLAVYAPGGGGSFRDYGWDFVLEAALVVNIGSKMMADMGPWSGLGVYFLVDQGITHPAVDINGDKDYWNPALLYGLTIPLAPWGK
jgi:hypothetical protein